MIRVRDTLIRHLDFVFTPPGLPLVPKQGGAVATTSIVVRGGPGTGKTTAALALALTVARQNGGRVLYLSTEIAPVDAQQKARELGIPAERIGSTADPRETDEVRVDHLAASSDANVEAPEQRLTASLNRAWELVEQDGGLRAIVIDAFALVGLEASKTTRAAVMDFIVALEGRGVSPVLVEEAPAPVADWLGYLVDLLFETSWGVDPDVGSRFRQLGCPKSRYVEAWPGPHDYGREGAALAVWPALAPIVGRGDLHGSGDAPSVLVGTSVLPAGSVLSDEPGLRGFVTNLLHAAPWLPVATVSALSPEGPHRAAWRALDAVVRQGRTLLRLDHTGAAARRSRYQSAVADSVAALAALGATLVVPVITEEDRGAIPFSHIPDERIPPFDVQWRPLSPLRTFRYGGTAYERYWGSSDMSVVEEVTTLIRRDHPNDPTHAFVYAAFHALHLSNVAALDWLVAQFETPERDLARYLAVACLVDHRRFDEAHAALAALPGVDGEVRKEVAAEIERRRT